ncbi:PAS domain S-box protein [Salisaeta longa]|uniref:PAS domain S-box protein n=1 Tax=Salisaeta longa TaxID=503170 RepID=UPI0003B389A5|nr:PAS domain S-box protein [Salisaeta longa]
MEAEASDIAGGLGQGAPLERLVRLTHHAARAEGAFVAVRYEGQYHVLAATGRAPTEAWAADDPWMRALEATPEAPVVRTASAVWDAAPTVRCLVGQRAEHQYVLAVTYAAEPTAEAIEAAQHAIRDGAVLLDALDEAPARYRLLFEKNPLPMWVYDRDTLRFLAVNDAAVETYGYSRADFREMTLYDLRPSDERARLDANLAEERPARERSGPWRHRTRDGTMRYVDIVSHTLTFKSRPAVLVSVHDVTAQHQAHRALQEREEYLEVTLQSIGDAVITTDAEGHVRRMNPQAEALTGWTADEAKGQPLTTVFHIINDETRTRAANPVAEVIASGHTVSLANGTILIARDGTEHRIADSAAPIAATGEPLRGVVLVFRDVTSDYAQEEALRQSRALLEEAQAIAHTGSFRLDLQARTITLSREGGRLFQMPPNTPHPLAQFSERIHPEDLDTVRTLLASLEGGEESYDITYRIVQPEGSVRWVRSRGRMLENVQGQPATIVGIATDVTERRAREAAAQRFGRLLEASINEIYFFRADTYTFVDVSRGALENLGYTLDELRSMTPADMTPFDRDGLDALFQPLREGTAEQVAIETRHIRRDGSSYPVDIRLQLSEKEDPPLFVAIGLDATERLEAQAQQMHALHRIQTLHSIGRAVLSAASIEAIAEAALQRLTHLVSHVRSSVVTYDAARDVATIRAVRGHEAPQLASGAQPSLASFRGARALQRDTVRYVRDLEAADRTAAEDRLLAAGLRSYIQAPLLVEDNVIGSLNIAAQRPDAFSAVDRTVTLEVADMLALAIKQARYEKQLIRAKETAETMNRLKTTFLANMSHEIRTPLTSIIGFSEVIGDDPSAAATYAPVIHRSGRRLLRTLNSVLDFAQLEAGAFTHAPVALNVTALAEQVLDDFRPDARHKNLTLSLVAEGPVEARLDERALERVLVNLIANAIKFTPEGSVTVSVTTPDDAHVSIAVRDTGVGIDPSFLPDVFNEFQQESSGNTRQFEGSGLGLTITKRLVELMGGTIAVESTKGQGATFTVTLPT